MPSTPKARSEATAIAATYRRWKGYTHEYRPYDPQAGMLHWLHILVGDAKAYIPGTYHGLPEQNQPSYPDEFCYRFNRRGFGEGGLKRLAAAVVG